jgi:uncharacterized protein YdaL
MIIKINSTLEIQTEPKRFCLVFKDRYGVVLTKDNLIKKDRKGTINVAFLIQYLFFNCHTTSFFVECIVHHFFIFEHLRIQPTCLVLG